MKSPLIHHYDLAEVAKRIQVLLDDDDARFEAKRPRMPDEQRRQVESILNGALGELRFQRNSEVF